MRRIARQLVRHPRHDPLVELRVAIVVARMAPGRQRERPRVQNGEEQTDGGRRGAAAGSGHAEIKAKITAKIRGAKDRSDEIKAKITAKIRGAKGRSDEIRAKIKAKSLQRSLQRSLLLIFAFAIFAFAIFAFDLCFGSLLHFCTLSPPRRDPC